jgi:hypothetical protein
MTVLLVSHQLQTVRHLCSTAIWLSGGHVQQIGPSQQVVDAYVRQASENSGLDTIKAQIATLPLDPAFRLLDVRVTQDKTPTTTVFNGKPVDVCFEYEVLDQLQGFRVGIDLYDEFHDLLIRSFHDDDAEFPQQTAQGRYSARCVIPACLLAPRDYVLLLQATIFNVRWLTAGGVRVAITVLASSPLNRAYPTEPIRAKLQPQLNWHVTREGAHGT